MMIQETPWTERLENLLTGLDPVIGVGTLKRLLDEKAIFAHEVFYEDRSIGFYVGRVDVLANGERELVVMHAVSDVKGPKPLAHILSQIFPAVGRQLGCVRVRIHSEIRKLDDLLESAGFKFMESVFVKDI